MSNYITHCKDLAHKHFKLGHFERALEIYQNLLQFGDSLHELHTNIASVYFFQHRLGEAIEHYTIAIELKPDYAEAHTFLSMAYLALEDFQNGWKEYEWRIRSKQFSDALNVFERFKWNGSPLGGGKIIVRAEQGFGDTIQFLRYLPLLKERSQSEVVFHCPPELRRLLEGFQAVDLLITDEEAIEGCRACVYLGSLPKIFETNLTNIPSNFPYIQSSKALVAEKKQLFQNDKNLKVGFVYTGNKQNSYNHFRSLPIDKFASLFALENITFYSLQKGDEDKQLEALNFDSPKIINLDSEISDFADTAAIIENLDLVISIDTSVAHLAGALNKPVWLMLSSAADWRWLLKRSDCPWYGSMRIFRQKEFGDWSNVVTEVEQALKTFRQEQIINFQLQSQSDSWGNKVTAQSKIIKTGS